MIYLREYGVITKDTDKEKRDFLKFVVAKMFLNALDTLTFLCTKAKEEISLDESVHVIAPYAEMTDQMEIAIELCRKYVVEFPTCTVQDVLVGLADDCQILKASNRRAVEIWFVVYDGFVDSPITYNVRHIVEVLMSSVYTKPDGADYRDIKTVLEYAINAESAHYEIRRLKRSVSKRSLKV